MAEISISMTGYTEMAMVGAFAGPIFLVLVGLPTSVIPSILQTGQPAKFELTSILHLESDEMLLMVGLVCNVIALLIFMFLTVKNK